MPCAKILVVDDNEEFLQFCHLSLKDKYEVTLANRPSKAVKRIKEEKPDLIILDVCMPETDGLTLAEQFKEDPGLQAIPIIMVTGLTHESELPPGFWRLGTPAQSFMNKPVDFADLKQEVEKVLARARGIDLKRKNLGGYL